MQISVDWDKGKRCGILKGDYLSNIREHFSVKDQSAAIKQRFNRFIPTRKYIITPGGRFEIGMYGEIHNYIKSLQIPFNISISNEFIQRFHPQYPLINTRLSALKLDLRDYQEDSIQKCLKQGNGTLVLATGAGKTLLMASLIKTLHDNIQNHFTVLVVPSLQLVEQTYKDFVEYGIRARDISRLSGNHAFELGKPIVIANSQYLMVSKQIPNLLYSADTLVIDEIHSLKKDNQLNKLVKKFITPHKFGLTGSLPENQIDIWNIIGKIGPLIYEKPSHELRKEGYLSDVEATVLRVHYLAEPQYIRPTLTDPLIAFKQERDFLYSHEFRNRVISHLAQKTEKNTLILTDRLKHGQTLKKIISSNSLHKKVYFVQGKVDVEVREKIRELMEKENNIVCIAIAKIFSTGINIKNLHYIIFAVSGKAKIRLVQSVGRGLRLHEDKEKLYILDISDQLKYGIQHERNRIKIYENEKIKYSIKDIYEK